MLRLFLILFALIPIFFASSAVAQSKEDPTDARKQDYWKRIGTPVTIDGTFRAAAGIKVGKPLNEYAAYVLANAYFLAHVNSCGGADLPKDEGDRWVAETRVGYFGKPGPKITIEKLTAVTHSPGRPKILNPSEYAKFIKQRQPSCRINSKPSGTSASSPGHP